MVQIIAAWDQGVLRPMDKIEVHRRGLRHPAVSVLVFHGVDLLIQQRAAAKYHSPGLWANTCCTHPEWQEDPHSCAVRRLDQELGLTGINLKPAGQISYRADVGQGMIEHEDVDVFVAHLRARPELSPDPSEVGAIDWRSMAALTQRMADVPDEFTTWFRIYLTEHGDRLFPRSGDWA